MKRQEKKGHAGSEVVHLGAISRKIFINTLGPTSRTTSEKPLMLIGMA